MNRSQMERLGLFSAAVPFFRIFKVEGECAAKFAKSGFRWEHPTVGAGEGRLAESSASAVEAHQYTYNMVENPGPLAELPGCPAANFAGGRYDEVILSEDTTLYRGGKAGTPLGQWFTRDRPRSVAQIRIDTAVLPHWVHPVTGSSMGSSPIDTVFTVRVPKGATIYLGPVANQGGVYKGVGEQIFISKPWLIPGLKVIRSEPLI